jgi:proteasome alpha subunit
MYPVSPSAYDRAITVFSPDGRLFQVEYAKEAVRRGATAIGLVSAQGVVLIAHKTRVSKLIMPESLKKIFEIDEHIAIVASGMAADAMRLIDSARVESQKYRYTYSEAPDVENVARQVADSMQLYTQYGGARPYGVSLIFAGVDSSPKIYEAEPSGALTGAKAAVIGAGKNEVTEYLEKEYKEGLSIDDTIVLGLKALKQVPEMKIKTDILDVGIIPTSTKKFELLTSEKVATYTAKL